MTVDQRKIALKILAALIMGGFIPMSQPPDSVTFEFLP